MAMPTAKPHTESRAKYGLLPIFLTSTFDSLSHLFYLSTESLDIFKVFTIIKNSFFIVGLACYLDCPVISRKGVDFDLHHFATRSPTSPGLGSGYHVLDVVRDLHHIRHQEQCLSCIMQGLLGSTLYLKLSDLF